MNALVKFKKQVESYEHLKFNDAKNLYLKAINTKDAKESKELMDRVVMGTMHAAINYFENSYLKMLNNLNYELDDLFSSFVEVWVSNIYKGILLNIESYGFIYNRVLSSSLINNVICEEKSYNELIDYNSSQCIDLFYKFASLKEHNDYSEEQRYGLFSRMIERLDPEKNARMLYLLFNDIYNSLKGVDVFEMPKKSISIYLKAFIHNKLTDRLENSLSYDGMEEMLANQEIFDLLHEALDNAEGISERAKYVIRKRYGLDGEAKTLKELGEEFGLSSCRIGQIEDKALRQLRHPSRSRRLYDFFN